LARDAKKVKKGFYRHVSRKRKVTESALPDEQEWKTDNNRQEEGGDTQECFNISLQREHLFPYLSSGWAIRQ